MSSYTAILDANVLYPAPMRDVLIEIAVTDLFKANGPKTFIASGSIRCCAMNRIATARPSNELAT
jgi:hypothetical protein